MTPFNIIRELARQGYGVDDILVKLKQRSPEMRETVKKIVWETVDVRKMPNVRASKAEETEVDR